MCVLLVDDEVLIRDILAESLEEAGYSVVRASTGDEAISVINEGSTTITALVTDFHMPGEADGADVASCVRQRWPGVPVVIASGRPDAMTSSWQEDRASRLLQKPYGPRELIKVLKALASAA